MKPLQLAVIGFGGQGQWHADNIKERIPGIHVRGIFDVRESAEQAARERNLEVYPDAESLFADPEVDLVLIATPNHVHADDSIRAMRAGKHVVCEKPVCMNSAELETVLAVATETGKLFTVHHNRRWDADYEAVRRILAGGLVGKPYFIDSRLFGSKGLPGDWRSCPETGGGMLYDWGVHLVDQMLMLIPSDPVRVFVDAKKVRFPSVDDCDRILIWFADGTSAQIVVDSWCYVGENRWHVSADDGSFVIPIWGSSEGRVVKANIERIGWEEGVVFTANGRSSTMAPRPVEHVLELPVPEVGVPRWEEFYENVEAAIRDGAEPIVTQAQIQKTTLVMDACFRSAETGRTVEL